MSKRILAIDDEETIRKIYMYAFKDTVYKVETATSGESGVGLLREFKYDLIFLDIHMPGMNGIEVLREIRKTDEDVPIYIVTAFYKKFLEEIGSAIEEGLKFEIIHKPITIKQIVSIADGNIESSNS